MFRFGCVSGGASLFAPQAHNNIVRVAYETGIARVADPLGGSYYVEALTHETESAVIEIMADLERHDVNRGPQPESR